YAGTEYGLFVSMDDGEHWQPFQQNLPVTPITDIKVHQKDLVISTMGRSFWIMDNLTPLHEMESEPRSLAIFNTEPGKRMYFRGSRGEASVPSYRNPSILLDFYLPADADKGITLEISKADANTPIRTFRNITEVKDETLTEERNMQTEFRRRGITAGLPVTKGMHRFSWDMRHQGIWDEEEKTYRGVGPYVVPGQYEVKLTANGNTVSTIVEVDVEQRVKDAGVTMEDLKMQESLSLQIQDLRAKAEVFERSIKKKMKDNKDLKSIHEELVTKEGRYEQPMLLAQTNYLYRMLQRADQRPGKDAYDRHDQLKSWLEKLQKKAQELMTSD
ncbi:MAG: hypothetical protein KJP00_03315, partial [Bacteroidia bacterium]|nr:hypothetical protein [Bacteroidia bacterium]